MAVLVASVATRVVSGASGAGTSEGGSQIGVAFKPSMEVEADGDGSGSGFGELVRSVVLVVPTVGPERSGCDGFFSRTGARTALSATGGCADSAVRAPNVLAEGSRPERAGSAVDCGGGVFSERFVVDTTGAGATVDDDQAGAVFEPGAAGGADGEGSGSAFGRLGRVTLLVTAAVKRAVSNTTGAGTNGGGNQADATFEPNAEDGTICGRGGSTSGGLGRVMVVVSATTPERSDCDNPLPRICVGGLVWSPGFSRFKGVAG